MRTLTTAMYLDDQKDIKILSSADVVNGIDPVVTPGQYAYYIDKDGNHIFVAPLFSGFVLRQTQK